MGSQKNQRGALLIELAIGIALLTLMAVGTVSWMAQQAEKTKVESLAVAMQAVQQGMQSFLDTHAAELISATDFTVSGISNMYEPTLSELQQLGFLAPSFTTNASVKIGAYKEGACPGTSCHIHALIYSTQALVNKKQQIDLQAIAQWQGAVKGAGLVLQPQYPDAFTGVQRVVELQNLPSGLTFSVGSVALLASVGGLEEDTRVGRYLVLPHTERLGDSCLTEGAVTRNEEGQGLLVCEENKWIRASAEAEVGSMDDLKALLRTYWRINVPDETPGGFFIKQRYMFTYYCWVPNMRNIYKDGRGICTCKAPYRGQRRTVSAVKDPNFQIGIDRPELDMYICV